MRIERILVTVFLAMAAVLFAFQMRSIFQFPQPNSFRWFGDETWLMSEAKEQITTGVVQYPLAMGSTLEHGKGVVLSMTWLSAVLYGIPVWISNADPVETGRVVTASLAIGLIVLLYFCARKLGGNPTSAAIAIVLLVSSRSFFFASHSARPDLLAGFIVVLFISIMTEVQRKNRERSRAWWFGYGAVVLFLAFSSSIHLLTLLTPVSIYFLWRTPATTRWRKIIFAVLGAGLTLAVLLLIYYFTTGNLTLFPSSAAPAQFQDVVSSIPILRPFSRSVQISNLIIRSKQFWMEAPAVFLLLLCFPFLTRTFYSNSKSFICAAIIVVFSWLLLEGAEINYLIHLLPLLFLSLAILFSFIWERSKNTTAIIMIIVAIIAFIVGAKDSISAEQSASAIAVSNQKEVLRIESSFLSLWHSSQKPRIVTEPITLDGLSRDMNFVTMTDHFISFQVAQEPFESFFHREHVNFVVLYNSPVYPKNREQVDPFYQTVSQIGRPIGTYIGTAGDMGRDYFDHSLWQDTLMLFQIPE